jgi:pimeloyl-ACP methyl ester carboxylesterase
VTAEALYEDLTTDVRGDVSTIKAPITLVVPWSEQGFGEERTLDFYKRQYAGAPTISFVPIGDSAHFVMLDQPEAFAAAVRAFVK